MVDGMISLTGGMSIISPDHIISSTFLFPSVWELVGAGLPEVCFSDSEQLWHFSDNTQNRRAHALAHARTNTVCLSHARTHVRIAFVSPFDSLLLCSSQTCRQWHPDPNNALNQYQQRWLRHLSLCWVTVGMTDANNSTDMFDHQVSATAGDTEHLQYPHEGHVAFQTLVFLARLLFYRIAVPSDQLSVWPCFPQLNESFMSLAMWVSA